ncbi:uncharacterized protein LOC128638889 [Bombina bombina]|uniref:uncharacterized protein LOC128638889 n=1 Tax=Bombina bombina TaxID=8345 RepID=UPI00235AF833|nr:uncharacterized protein LOC128638889 [Bombina bombina]
MQIPMVELLSNVHSRRCVGIEIINKTNSTTLTSPSSFCYSGYVLSPPPPTVSPGTTENCIFVKTPMALRGSVGLLVYHFQENTLVIMFSNPFDYNFYKTTFGIWITNETVTADKRQFQDLYQRKMPSASYQYLELKKSDSQSIEVSNDKVSVSATMSKDNKAILKVEIADKICKGRLHKEMNNGFSVLSVQAGQKTITKNILGKNKYHEKYLSKKDQGCTDDKLALYYKKCELIGSK